MRTFVYIVVDNDVPRCQTIAIPVAVYRFSSIFLDIFVFRGVPLSVEISYFMVILFYCYCSRGRLTNQGTNLGKVHLGSQLVARVFLRFMWQRLNIQHIFVLERW